MHQWKHFDHVLEAAERLCGTSSDAASRNTFLKPSLGTKLGRALLKCARLKKREAFKRAKKTMEAEADAFIALHASDWADSISSKSLMTRKLKRLKGPEVLPQSNNLVKLKDHVDSTIQRSINALNKLFTYSAYKKPVGIHSGTTHFIQQTQRR